MPRQLRIEYEGAIYHIMSRGNGGELIFLDDKDREIFLLTLQEASFKAEWQVHAYCLMNNHFHLVLETPKPTLVAGMKWLLGVYTQRFNKRHQHRGHLFAGRYKSLIVDGSDDYYLRTVCDYVHLNPARANLIKKDTAAERKEFSKIINARLTHQEESKDLYHHQTIRKGWKFGNKDFVERLHQKMTLHAKKENYLSVEYNENMEAKARKMIQEKLRELHLTPSRLSSPPCMDPIKTELAQFLRAQTTLSLKWIAKELQAGKPATLAVSLYREKRKIAN